MPSVDHGPFVGPKPYSVSEEHLFFGRESEIQEALSHVVSNPVLIIYGQPGAGKTSLVEAGLTPALADEDFEVLPSIRGLGGRLPQGIDLSEVANIYAFNSLRQLEKRKRSRGVWFASNITEFLSQRSHLRDKEHNFEKPRVLVFDQFEDLFLHFPERWQDREAFIEQLAESLGQDELLKIVLVVREDFIAQFDPFVLRLPKLKKMRLERLNEEKALEAIIGPVRADGTASFANGVAAKLVQNLLKVRVEDEKGQPAEVKGGFVEPVLLQVACCSLWEHVVDAGASLIDEESLRSLGDPIPVLALSDYYEEQIQNVARKKNLGVGLLRRWFEDVLITPSKTRGIAFRGRRETAGLPNSALVLLEQSYVIRSERRIGAWWSQLSHDRFIPAIRWSNQRWLARHPYSLEKGRMFESRARDWARNGWGEEGRFSPQEIKNVDRYLFAAQQEGLMVSDVLKALVEVSRIAIQLEECKPGVKKLSTKKVFIVHGHGAYKYMVVDFLKEEGLVPVKLEDEPGQGRTIIEKFEAYADVGFAVVLMTPDDRVFSTDDQLVHRARQNVILELGYFLAKLGRKRVCVLYKEGVEIPSDYRGVQYCKFSEADEHRWKNELKREIKAAGLVLKS